MSVESFVPIPREPSVDSSGTITPTVSTATPIPTEKELKAAGIRIVSDNEVPDNAIHAGELGRSFSKYGISDLKQKAAAMLTVVEAQVADGTYPYNRFINLGGASTGNVVTPGIDGAQDCIIWCTNLYFGLNRHPRVINAVKEGVEQYGIGGGTSAISGGFSSLHKCLETELATWVGKEEAILFPTGFTANLGAISALATPSDLILFDKNCHASIISGIRLSGASFKSFRTGDALHLQKILQELEWTKYDNVFVVTESVFSLTGEEAPIHKYAELKKQFGFYLFVDEAHSFGLYGEQGAGYCSQWHCAQDVDFLMGTLSKALGTVGGFVACSKAFAALLRASSSPYLFQACITNPDAIATLEALKIILETPALQETLWENTHYFRSELRKSGFDVGNSKSPIVPIYVSSDEKLSILCKQLYQHGVYTNWVAYPGVKKGAGRLRFIVSSMHSRDQIEFTLEKLKMLGKQYEVIG